MAKVDADGCYIHIHFTLVMHHISNVYILNENQVDINVFEYSGKLLTYVKVNYSQKWANSELNIMVIRHILFNEFSS